MVKQRQVKKVYLATMLAIGVAVGSVSAMSHPVTIENQGSFMAGGTVVTAPGTYDSTNPKKLDGQTMHGDSAYVFWQRPLHAKKLSMVFLHGYGQSGKSWETTPDGRDGFQNIFLEKGYTTYIVDQPRRGRGGQSTVPANLTATPQDQLWYYNFRIGEYPGIYEGVAVPRDEASKNQFFAQMVPDTGALDNTIVAKAMDAVIDKSGDSILVTHSAGGGPGWLTAMHNPHVKAVIALEPGTFPFPEGQVPPVEATSSPFPAVGMAVSNEEFAAITKIPIVVYFGDNVPSGSKILDNWGFDNWRVRKNLADVWATYVNAHGGDVTIVSLPDIGIKGNTHFMMADLNNRQVADAMETWMKSKGLTK